MAAFSQSVIGNLKSGAIAAKEIAVDSFSAFQGTIDNLLIKGGLVSPVIKTNLISPLAENSDVTIQIGKVPTETDSGFGKLIVENASGDEVAAIDTAGNADFAGDITAQNLEIVGATVSGELYAAKINSPELDKIQDLLRQVQEDQTLLAESTNWEALIPDNATISAEMTFQNLFVTGQAAMASLSLSNSLAVGTDLIIQTNSLNTISAPLSLQSLAMAPIEMMAGKLRIETNGDVKIQGNLYVAGVIESQGLTVKDDSDIQVAMVDASGSAEFKKISTGNLIIAGGEATTSATLAGLVTRTNATAGVAILPAGTAEMIIENPSITNYTLVYITPTSSTNNQVLYIKSKETGKFIVGFNNPIDADVSFNWWIIETSP
jgi:hypothetical protein